MTTLRGPFFRGQRGPSSSSATIFITICLYFRTLPKLQRELSCILNVKLYLSIERVLLRLEGRQKDLSRHIQELQTMEVGVLQCMDQLHQEGLMEAERQCMAHRRQCMVNQDHVHHTMDHR